MSKAPPAEASAGCRNLLSLAAFEIAAGFVGTAREHLINAAHCSATGCCASPRLCRASAAPPPPPRPAVVSLPATRAGGGSSVAGGAAVVSLRPAIAAPAPDAAGNKLERRPLSLERVAASRRLSQILEYWRELWVLSHGAMVNFDAVRLVQISAVGWVHLIDVTDPDPARFTIPIRGWCVPNAQIQQSREGMRLSDHPVRVLTEGVLADYAEAREREAPLYHCVHSELRGHRYAYRRLILPLSSDGQRTDRLLVATDFA